MADTRRLAVRGLRDVPDGTPYRNEGMQRLEIRWGRIHQDRLFEDTQAVAEALARLSEAEADGDASALPTAHEPP